MPPKTEHIPTLSGTEMDKFHFDTWVYHHFRKAHTDLFHINRIEDVKELFKFPLPPHRKTVFDFVFLTRGSSIRSKGLDKYEFEADTFFFLPAYQISSHDYYSKDVTGFYCHFEVEVLSRDLVRPGFIQQFSFLHFISNPLVKIDDNTRDYVMPILHRLEREHGRDKPNYTLVSTYLCALFLELQPFAVNTEKVKENAALRITQQYKNALVQHIYEKQLVNEYADFLAVTPKHLNKCVKAATGKSAHDLLNDMILLEVKALLKQTQLSISEIAWKVGKEDPSDFTRFFRSKAGLTPTQYRQMA